jgi:hypothetical protein
MISLSFAMLVAAQGGLSDSREAYARCLKDFSRNAIEQKTEPAAFETALAAACKDKEALLKSALLQSDRAMGVKAAASEKGAAEQLADYRAMAKEDYAFEWEAAAKPKP